jgi:hypothetical protein
MGLEWVQCRGKGGPMMTYHDVVIGADGTGRGDEPFSRCGFDSQCLDVREGD